MNLRKDHCRSEKKESRLDYSFCPRERQLERYCPSGPNYGMCFATASDVLGISLLSKHLVFFFITTPDNGSLGSQVDEERSKLCETRRIAGLQKPKSVERIWRLQHVICWRYVCLRVCFDYPSWTWSSHILVLSLIFRKSLVASSKPWSFGF